MRTTLTTSIVAFLATMSVVSAMPTGGDSAYIDNSNTNSPHLVNAPVTAPIEAVVPVDVDANVLSHGTKVKRCHHNHEDIKKKFPQGPCPDGKLYVDNSNTNSDSLVNLPITIPVDGCVPIDIVANILSHKVKKRWYHKDDDNKSEGDEDEGDEGDSDDGEDHKGSGKGGHSGNGEGSGPCPPGYAYVDNSNKNSPHLINLPVTAPVKACVPINVNANVLSNSKRSNGATGEAQQAHSENEKDEKEKDEHEKDENEDTSKDGEQ